MKKNCNFLGIVILLSLLSACSATTPPEPITMKVGLNLWPGYYPLFVAQGKDLYAPHHLQIEQKIYGDIGEVVQDLQTHKLDVGFVTISDALTLDSRNPGSFKVVLGTDYSNGSDMVIARSDIKNITDLRGKRVGLSLGTFGELFVRKMLESQKMTMDDIRLVNTNASEIPDAIPALIDAGQTFEPYASQGLAKEYHVLFSSADTPGLIPGVVVFRNSFVQEHPEAVRTFIKVWFEAQEYWQAHPTESNELITKATGLKLSEISTDGIKLLNLADNLKAFNVSTDATSLYGSGQINSDFLLEAGIVNNVPDIKRVLDPSFLTEK